MPVEYSSPQDAEQKAERQLAHDLRQARAAGELDEAAKAELDELIAQKRTGTDKLLEDMRRLGRTPVEYYAPQDADQKAERRLARQLRDARAAGKLDGAAKAELDELIARSAAENARRTTRLRR